MTDRPEKINMQFTSDDDGYPKSGGVWAHTDHTYDHDDEIIKIRVSALGDTWKQARDRVNSKIADIREAVENDSSRQGCPTCGRPGVGSSAAEIPLRGSGIKVEVALCESCGTVYRNRRGED